MIHAYMHTGMHAYMKLKHIEQTSKDSNRKNILICFALDGKLCLSNSLFIFFCFERKILLIKFTFFLLRTEHVAYRVPRMFLINYFSQHMSKHLTHHTHTRTHAHTNARKYVQRCLEVGRGTQTCAEVRRGTRRYAEVCRCT